MVDMERKNLPLPLPTFLSNKCFVFMIYLVCNWGRGNGMSLDSFPVS